MKDVRDTSQKPAADRGSGLEYYPPASCVFTEKTK
jgi:hypothetical protein